MRGRNEVYPNGSKMLNRVELRRHSWVPFLELKKEVMEIVKSRP